MSAEGSSVGPVLTALVIAVWLAQADASADPISPGSPVQSAVTSVDAFSRADAVVLRRDAASPDFSALPAYAYSSNRSLDDAGMLAGVLDEAFFDRWLMLVVGGGLVAVQLRRKQRELRRPKRVI